MSIWAFLAVESSETAATRFCETIRDATLPLRHFPEAGAPRNEIVDGLRATFSGRYVVYYVTDQRHLTIVRILHGARDLAAIIAARDFEI